LGLTMFRWVEFCMEHDVPARWAYIAMLYLLACCKLATKSGIRNHTPMDKENVKPELLLILQATDWSSSFMWAAARNAINNLRSAFSDRCCQNRMIIYDQWE